MASNFVVWGHKRTAFFTNKKVFTDTIKFKLDELSLQDLTMHFTCGYCYHLALHLSKATGLPVYNVVDNHAVVGDGKMFLDITGWQTKKQLLSKWEGNGFRKGIWRVEDPESEFEGWGDWIGAGEELGPKKMQVIVQKVLDTYGADPVSSSKTKKNKRDA